MLTPVVIVKFLDEARKRSSIMRMGPWSGTFPWKQVEEVAAVPAWAREASLMVGMGGGTGTLDADQVAVSAEPR